MSKQTIQHGKCPECNHNDCYSEWDNGGYHCHSCGIKGTHKKERKEIVDEGLTSQVKTYRNLTEKAVKKYKTETLVDRDGKDVSRIYHYPHKNKCRILPKDFSQNKGFTNDYLFGMDLFNAGSSRSITIVEGEDDAPAAWQMLGGTKPVVAIPGSEIKEALIKNCFDYLDSFKEVIVATDSDAAGDKAWNRIASLFPNKSYRVSLTKHNDPMEFLAAGDSSDFKFAWENKTKYTPEFDTSTPKDYLKVLDEGEDDAFISSGIEAYDKNNMGLFQGHVTLFQAPEGTGKTELFHFFEHQLITNYPDIPFASCHLEEAKRRTTLAWASYDLGKNVTRKDLIKDMGEVKDSISRMTKSENAHLFSIGTEEDPMVLIDRIRYYHKVFQCRYFFIEPIQDLAQQYDGPESTERFLSKIAVRLARIASELNVGILLIAHENDEGKVSDCRKLAKQASVGVRLERDMDSTDDVVRNLTTLRVLKNRPASFVGFSGQVSFDPETFVLSEYYGD